MRFSVKIVPQPIFMEKNQIPVRPEESKLTVVKKYKVEEHPAKMITLKRIEHKPQLLLPPPEQSYIKPKKHDFL